MANAASAIPKSRKASKAEGVTWLARLTHPLVFFGAALVVCESTIGTALVSSKHSDNTVIVLCILMCVVILAAFAVVGIIAYRKPHHLMLTTQDKIGEELRVTHRVKEATRLLMESPEPKTPREVFKLMDKIEALLSGGNA